MKCLLKLLCHPYKRLRKLYNETMCFGLPVKVSDQARAEGGLMKSGIKNV